MTRKSNVQKKLHLGEWEAEFFRARHSTSMELKEDEGNRRSAFVVPWQYFPETMDEKKSKDGSRGGKKTNPNQYFF